MLPNSDEHIVPESVGGRPKARILCGTHNNGLSDTDKIFAEHYAPVTWGAAVNMQSGKVGTSLSFIDSEGRRTRVASTGHAEYRLHDVERNVQGLVERAQGALQRLMEIGPVSTFSPRSALRRPGGDDGDGSEPQLHERAFSR